LDNEFLILPEGSFFGDISILLEIISAISYVVTK